MTPPEQIAAKLDATWAGWTVLYGRYSRQFIAFPVAALTVPAEHAGLIIAKDHHELERRMARLHRPSWHAHGKPRSHPEHQPAVPPIPGIIDVLDGQRVEQACAELEALGVSHPGIDRVRGVGRRRRARS